MAIRIPYEFQEVEYIESTGTQYIDTGVAYSENVSFDVTGSFTDKATTNPLIGTNTYVYTLLMGSDGKVGFQCKKTLKYMTSSALSVDQLYNFKASINGLWIDDVSQPSVSDSGSNVTTNMLVFLMGTTYGRAKITSLKMYSDSNFTTLVRDYVPCYRKSDGAVGLYDLVNNTFYENAGTGTFSMGKAINFVDRKFTDGTVGSTNVIEGMVIKENPYEQFVNYVMLYDYGNECEELTGGWEFLKDMGLNSGALPTLEKNSDHIRMYGSNSTWKGSAVLHSNIFDFTDYSKCFAFVDVTGDLLADGSPKYYARIKEGKTNSTTTLAGQRYQATGKHFEKIDLTGVSNGYVFLDARTAANSVANLKIYAVLLTVVDDYATLANKAGITASSIDDILTASTTLLANKGAVNFMVAQCTGDFMLSAIQNSTFMSALETSPYKTLIQSNEHWAKFLAMVA